MEQSKTVGSGEMWGQGVSFTSRGTRQKKFAVSQLGALEARVGCRKVEEGREGYDAALRVGVLGRERRRRVWMVGSGGEKGARKGSQSVCGAREKGVCGCGESGDVSCALR
jgi:hypothetical protein